MTTSASETTSAPRLERPRESAFRGVCAAIARVTGTDPVLWRVLVVVLTFFDGLGIVLYLIGMAAIPYEGEQRSIADRLLHGPDRRFSRGDQWLLVILAIAAVSYFGHPRSVVVAVVFAGLGFLWWRSHEDTGWFRTTRSSSAGSGELPPMTASLPTEPLAPLDPAPWAPPPPPRPRSPLGGVTFGVAAVVAGVLTLIGIAGHDMPVAGPIAAALAVVGIGLVAGCFFGRSWGLCLLAALLTAALAVANGVQPLLDDGVGKRDWSPSSSASYRLGAGKGVLDLTAVGPVADITAHVGYGQLLVEVPAGLLVDVDARSDYGDIELYGKDYGGRRQHETVADPDATVHLHLSVRAGEIKVVRL
jgi:phage shock protein PspC (stress-responsive transcriptional regulator)